MPAAPNPCPAETCSQGPCLTSCSGSDSHALSTNGTALRCGFYLPPPSTPKNPIISCIQLSVYQHESCIPSTSQATQGNISPQRFPNLQQTGKIKCVFSTHQLQQHCFERKC
ncbi:hypothetical protein Nmel_000159, partial [Mimus melanotis]